MKRRALMKVHKALLIAAALALGLTAAGCSGAAGDDGGDQIASAGGNGSSDQSSESSEGEAPAKDQEERQLQFAECMRDNGVDIPDSADGGVRLRINGEVEREEMEAAMDACRQYAPGGEEGFQMSEEEKQQMAEYVDCLQQEGLEISDPNPETGVPDDAAEYLMDPDDDTQAAMDACQDKRPNRMMMTGRR
jgi:hypothetical protein